MKKLIITTLIVLIVAILVWRFVQRGQVEATMTIKQMQAEQGYPVEVDQVRIAPFQLSKTYTGTITGGQQSIVISQLSEVVSKVYISEGQLVNKGTVICELSRENPQASYGRAKLALGNLENELDRFSKLLDDGAVSQQTFDAIKLQHDIAVENLASSEELLYIRAPFTGMITELNAETGKLAMPGMPLAKMISKREKRVEVSIPSGDRGKIYRGASCQIKSGKYILPGKVSRIAYSADPEARDFTAWISFDIVTDEPLFSPGILAVVAIEHTSVEEAIVLPADALIRQGEKYFVYKIENDKAHYSQIEIGGISEATVWVKSGANPGESVVVSGAELLSDGVSTRIIDRDQG